jgi:aspartate-semialdehyde dehydrogenase
VPPGNAHLAAEADLFRSLLAIRSGAARQGLESAQHAIRQFEHVKSYGDAAAARLSAAEVLLVSLVPHFDQLAPAAQLAEEAIAFAEPRHIWESLFRGRLIAVQAQPERAELHTSAARSALSQIRMSWTAPDVDRYLQRSDIRRLTAAVRF